MRRRVIPAQRSIFPAHLQPQNRAAAIVHRRRVPAYRNGPVYAVHQRPARQPGGIAPPPVRVKQPVFLHPKAGIVQQLAPFIVSGRSVRCHFQHKIRRLALLADSVPALLQNVFAPDVESDEQVGNPHPVPPPGDFPGDGNLAQHNRSVRVAQMPAQSRLVALVVEMTRVHHIRARRKIGEPGNRRRRRRPARPAQRRNDAGGRTACGVDADAGHNPSLPPLGNIVCYRAGGCPKCARYCAAKSIPTRSLNAVISRCVTGPGASPLPTAAPFTAATGQMHRLVEVRNASSAV